MYSNIKLFKNSASSFANKKISFRILNLVKCRLRLPVFEKMLSYIAIEQLSYKLLLVVSEY